MDMTAASTHHRRTVWLLISRVSMLLRHEFGSVMRELFFYGRAFIVYIIESVSFYVRQFSENTCKYVQRNYELKFYFYKIFIFSEYYRGRKLSVQ